MDHPLFLHKKKNVLDNLSSLINLLNKKCQFVIGAGDVNIHVIGDSKNHDYIFFYIVVNTKQSVILFMIVSNDNI